MEKDKRTKRKYTLAERKDLLVALYDGKSEFVNDWVKGETPKDQIQGVHRLLTNLGVPVWKKLNPTP